MNIVLIGHTYGIKNCIEKTLQSNEHKITAVFTHPKEQHKYDFELYRLHKEKWDNYFFDVFNVPNIFNIPVIEYFDINNDNEISEIKKFDPDVIVTVGCRDILKNKFIKSFKYVINLHPFHLPYWRGGGIDSWMILNNCWNTIQYATSHFITTKIDAGNIIAQLPYKIKNKAYPIDIFKERIKLLGDLLILSLEKLKNGFVGIPQNINEARYFPKINTLKNGHINLNWNIEHIEKFIYAFSYPYPGSFLMLDETKIHILEAEFFKDNHVHPFSIGLIFNSIPNQSF